MDWLIASWQALPASMLIVGPFVCVLAYIIYGLTGFGSTLLAAPVYVHFLPMRMVVPLQVVLDLSATLVLGNRMIARVVWREVLWMAPFLVVGMSGGVALLVHVPERLLLAAFALFVLVNGLLGLRPGRRPRPMARPWVAPLGLAAGAAGAMFGAGGPMVAIFFAGRIEDKEALRATIAATILFNGTGRLIAFLVAGLLSQPGVLLLAVWLLPSMVLGQYLGNRLHLGLPATQVRRAIHVVLVVAGLSLFARLLA